MKVLKPLSKLNTGRRSFMYKMGTAMSAALAVAVPSMSSSRNNQGTGLDAEVDRLSKQLGILEDEKAIRTLHESYETCLDNGMYEEVVELFTEDGAVVSNGGAFEGKKGGISRLYRDCFRPGLTGKKIGPVPGFQATAEQQSGTLNVAADRLSAKAQVPFTIQVGTPMAPDSQLVQMARLQGEGIVKWWEGGIYEVSYVKVGESWKIKRLEYRAASKADYRPGKTYAKPIEVPTFSSLFPKNPTGPDKLVTGKQWNA